MKKETLNLRWGSSNGWAQVNHLIQGNKNKNINLYGVPRGPQPQFGMST